MIDRDWLHELPDGWVTAFGDDMLKEMDDVATRAEAEYPDFEYHVVQVKEKYGGLRWYDNGMPAKYYDEFQDIVNKYEDLSFETCVVCGKKGKLYTDCWYSAYCEEHKDERR